MDFSSTERALESLQKRNPQLSPRVQLLAKSLLHGTRISDPTFLASTRELLDIGTSGETDEPFRDARWEPLAVGFHLAAAFLQYSTTFFQSLPVNVGTRSSHDGSVSGTSDVVGRTKIESKVKLVPTVYMDGPRVPITVDSKVDEGEEEGEGGAKGDKIQDSRVNVDGTKNIKGQQIDSSEQGIMDENQIVPFCEYVMIMCEKHLEHNEPRVRSLVAKVIGHHANLGTTLEKNMNIGPILIQQSIHLYNTVLNSLYEHLESGRDTDNKSKSSEGALDDTTGWRALETNLYGIGSFVQASGHRYFAFSKGCNNGDKSGISGMESKVDEKLLQNVEYCCVKHVNRHVRAAGISVLEQMVHACTSSFQDDLQGSDAKERQDTSDMNMLMLPDSKLRQTIVEVLKTALADNWSQVRMAGSVLCRVFFVAMLEYAESCPDRSMEDRESWLMSLYPVLLPRMCLNRFYLAQGVKLYSHETWRIVFEKYRDFAGSGLENVAIHGGAICRYYTKMADADNHVVREAACQAIAELATKIGRSEQYSHYLAPYVISLLQALLMCFHDESWPVRDEACLACGTFCLAYPKECEPELPTLFSRWTEQLTDQIWSVREDAAVALGDAIEAYGSSMFDKAMEILNRDLPSAKKQPAMSREEYKRRQNDIAIHTDSQLYSCGSLAPKLRKGGAGRIGCSSCAVDREKAPWEATDGCIYLLRELCTRLCNPNDSGIIVSDDVLLPIMTELVDTCRVKHFPQSDDLRTTLWKQLPLIAKALGKQRFKRSYLHMFLDMLIDNLDEKTNASQLSVHAAGQCAEELANLVGMSILRGRLEDGWQRDIFDAVIEKRRGMAKTMPSEGFSPFGPAEAMLAMNPQGGDSARVRVPVAVPKIPTNSSGLGMTESF